MNNLLKISNLKHRFLRKKIFKGVIGTILIYFYMNKCIIRFTVNVATLYIIIAEVPGVASLKKNYILKKKNVEICFAYDTPGRSTQGFSEKISAHSVQPFGLS